MDDTAAIPGSASATAPARQPVGPVLLEGGKMVQDRSGQGSDSVVNVDVLLGRSLEELEIVFVSDFLSHLAIDDAFGSGDVTLVGQDDFPHHFVSVLRDHSHPARYVVERPPIGDVIDQHHPMGTLVVGGGDGLELLLTRRVPHLNLDPLPVHVNCLQPEVYADG